MTKSASTLIFIPTYNEAGNVEQIYSQIKNLDLEADILFLDDNSPDGTGKIIQDLASNDHNVHSIHREGKQGIGSAHIRGITWAYQHSYSTLITMDCDFAHKPEYITDFISNTPHADIVVGSRYLNSNSLETWNMFRKTLTHTGHILTKNMLDMPYDASGAFRLYNLRKIPIELFHLVESESYSFFFESLFILHLNGKKVQEIPIDLPARTYGASKMTWHDARKSVHFLLNLFIRKNFNKKSLIINNARNNEY